MHQLWYRQIDHDGLLTFTSLPRLCSNPRIGVASIQYYHSHAHVTKQTRGADLIYVCVRQCADYINCHSIQLPPAIAHSLTSSSSRLCSDFLSRCLAIVLPRMLIHQNQTPSLVRSVGALAHCSLDQERNHPYADVSFQRADVTGLQCCPRPSCSSWSPLREDCTCVLQCSDPPN